MSFTEMNFEEYIRQGEPSQIEKAKIWRTSIGLQKVDGLTPSEYLMQTARENIEGNITLEDVQYKIDNYYKQQENISLNKEMRTEEADKVAANIAKLLSEQTFSCSPAELLSIHKRLFTGVDVVKVKVGQFRDYNITKAEWVLNGKTVFYASFDNIKETLEYDFLQEKSFNYKNLSKRDVIEHIALFISDLWQIHAFGEGNTRTIAVFVIKYLRTLGFVVENDMFADHSWFFRNALVRANFNDYENNIYATQEYLNKFFANLLLGEKNELKNRELRIYVGKVSEKAAVYVGDMSEKVSQILDLMLLDNTISALQLAVKLNTTSRTIEREIKKMKDANVIERVGGGRGGYWKILNK